MDDEMQQVLICEQFGWTYEEYMDQPTFFLDLIKRKLMVDNKEREMNLRKLHHG